MKIGIQINRFTWPGAPESIAETLAKIVVAADKNGFSSAWVMDHFFQIHYVGKSEEPMLEAYTTLGYIAGLTKHIKLGTMVTGVIYRNPSLLIKAVTTLDVLSKGRAYLGIGAAWNEEESAALGFEFPPLKERFEQLEDALQLAHQMWKGDEKPFKGKHHTSPRPMNSPQALSKPHPPILIGGGGEKKTLKFVAQYADACNLFAREGNDVLIHKLNVLKEHCKEVGRDYNEIEKTVLDFWPPDSTAQEFIDHCKELKKLGINHIIMSFPNVETITPIEKMGKEIIPAVSKL
jgi:F420-dependent oxidoreductase-like protein